MPLRKSLVATTPTAAGPAGPEAQPNRERTALALAARLCAASLALAPGAAAYAQTAPAAAATAAPAPATTELPPIKVTARPDRATEGTGAYTAPSANTATGLDLSLRDTPQSISVVTRALIDDFALHDANDLLAGVTGVNVERVEPDRSYFSVRGFEVSNFQTDGTGLPFATGDQIGQIDTALYDRVEVLRGANGLTSSTGNPSATVNLVRKRPTAGFQASAALTAGSWNTRRVDADVSGALDDANTVRGRLVVAARQADSYLDRYTRDKHLFSGIVEVDLGPATTLTLGHSQEHNRPEGVMWGALATSYSDGTPTQYARSASSAAAWTYWNTDDTQTFGELVHRFAGDWQAKAVLTRRELASDAELFYVYGSADPDSGEGLFSYPSKYGHTERQWIADLSLRGPFTLAGRRHELVAGASWARSDNALHSSDDDVGLPLTESEMLAGSFPRPAFDNGLTGFADFDNRRNTLFAAVRANPADTLQLIAGANVTRASSSGVQYTVVHDYRQTKATPYAGATWAFDDRHSLYASAGRIFNPQYQTDQAGAVLPPIEGSNRELGVKGEWMEGRLNGSFALFRTRQDNTAEAFDFDEVTGRTIYRGVDATSTGFELDLAGTLAPGWELSGGYTQMKIEDPDGADARTYVPRRTLRLSTSARVPALPGLKLGASLKWQSDYRRSDGEVVTEQPAYALLDLMASYELTPHVLVSAKLDNATDKTHLNSLMWPQQTFYGAPRNGSVTVKWTY